MNQQKNQDEDRNPNRGEAEQQDQNGGAKFYAEVGAVLKACFDALQEAVALRGAKFAHFHDVEVHGRIADRIIEVTKLGFVGFQLGVDFADALLN